MGVNTAGKGGTRGSRLVYVHKHVRGVFIKQLSLRRVVARSCVIELHMAEKGTNQQEDNDHAVQR